MSEPVRSITIEFERMPGLPRKVVIHFTRKGNVIDVMTLAGDIVRRGRATCHPTDTFSWETGMRLAMKRARNDLDKQYCPRCRAAFYDSFRRWMWLAKAAHECRKHIKPHGCDKCPNYDNDRSCRTLYQPHWWATPESIIAAEFGRVKVRVE